MAFRCAGESAAALAVPPFAPPSFPSATAAEFLPAFVRWGAAQLLSDGLLHHAARVRRVVVILGLAYRVGMVDYEMKKMRMVEKYEPEPTSLRTISRGEVQSVRRGNAYLQHFQHWRRL